MSVHLCGHDMVISARGVLKARKSQPAGFALLQVDAYSPLLPCQPECTHVPNPISQEDEGISFSYGTTIKDHMYYDLAAGWYRIP